MALGALETEVLSVVTELGEAKPKQIFLKVRERRPIAYTSVTNTLHRLAVKGLLRARKLSPKRVYYSIDHGDAYRTTASLLVDRLVRAFGDSAISNLVARAPKTPRGGARGKP